MLNNLSQILASDSFKAIPKNLDVHQFIEQVVPTGFEQTVNVRSDGFDCFITATNEDSDYVPEIMINHTVFNPDYRQFPMFMITDLNTTLCVLNQNQMLHLMLVYRLTQFQPMKRPYLNLISSDVQGLLRYIQYTESNSYNSKIKNKNLTVVMPYEGISELMLQFSETILGSRMDEDKWNAFFAKNDVDVSSVGSMSSSNAVVLRDNRTDKYRNTGFDTRPNGFVSIFAPAQNVPARHQTHTLGDSFVLSDPSQSVIQQDNIIVDGKMVSKDNSLKKAITLFHPIEENGRFLSGEIEIDETIASQLLKVSANIEDCFSDLNVKVGKTYYPNFKDFVLGINLLEDEVIISNAQEIYVKDIVTTGINSSRLLKLTVVKRADNARITSNTGLKGVTKVVSDLGQIHFASPEEVVLEETWEDSFERQVAEKLIEDKVENSRELDDLKQRYPNLDFEELTQFPSVAKEALKQPLVIKPDLICGMNSVKAKSNTIVMAQACLAVELGFYVPVVKHGFEGLLDSLNQAEINEAAQSLPEFTYINAEGHEVSVEIGLTYISYTEMCSIYTKVKPQSFPFLSGYYLSKNNESAKQVYQYIWDNYLEEEKIEASKEFYKILLASDQGIYNNEDKLPLYTLDQINTMFNQNDLVLSTVNEFPSDSKLLDEEFNKGFFIDLSKYEGAPVIRIPSAKTLNLFSGTLKNGSIIYHINFINVCKIIRGCLRTEKGLALNTVYSKDPNRKVSSLAYYAYLNTVRSTLFSGDTSSQQIVQSFIKPKIKGCNFKQVADHHLPLDTVVINDDRVYRNLMRESLKGSEETVDQYQIRILAQMLSMKNESIEEQKELFRLLNEECPSALAIRQPSLWETQNCVAKVWDRFMYEIYLNLYHNKSLSSVMNTYYNRDILLTSKDLIIKQHADCDGDLFPLFFLDYKGQKLLRNFKLTNVLPEELEWHKKYKLKEFSSTHALEVEHTYKLHLITTQQYSKFLNNAVTAKGNIGLASLDIWAFSMIVEVYQSFCIDNDYRYQKKKGVTALTLITDAEAKLLVYTYTRLVQEMVIEGVKHVKNGSKDFDMYFLKNIGDPKHERKIRQDMNQLFGLSSDMIDKLLFIIRFAEDNNNMSKACRNFLSLYNKGRSPANTEALDYWEDYIASSTYFGKLLSPLFSIKTRYVNAYQETLDSQNVPVDYDMMDMESALF